MEKMREEFEIAVLKGELLPCNSVSRNRDNGEYSSVLTTVAWVSWQASRAAQCVEIPTNGEASSFGNYVVFDSDDVRAMLDAAGIRYV